MCAVIPLIIFLNSLPCPLRAYKFFLSFNRLNLGKILRVIIELEVEIFGGILNEAMQIALKD